MATGKTKLHSQKWPLPYQGSRRVLQNNGRLALVPFWRAKSMFNFRFYVKQSFASTQLTRKD